MPLDGAPTTLFEALLRERGLAPRREANEAIRASTQPPVFVAAHATIETLTRKVHDAVSGASEAGAFGAALDRLLEEGAALAFWAILPAVIELPVEEILRAIERFRRSLAGLTPETHGLVLEALGVQEQLQPIVNGLITEVPPAAVAEVHQSRVPAPLGYLTEFPVEIAALFLAQERGLLASIAALSWIERADAQVAAAPLSLAARFWRDGMRASARLLASVRPDLVSEGLVPAVERLDIAALVARRKQEDAWLAELVAAHPDDDRFAVYPDVAGHDAP